MRNDRRHHNKSAMYFIFIIPPKPQTHHNLDSHRVRNIQNQLECAYFITIIIVDIYV